MHLGFLVTVTAFILTSAALLGSVACQSIPHINKPSISTDPCANADWFEVGRLDGLQGLSQDVSAYVQRCHTYFQEELYANGRNRGLVDFCTAERGFDAGRSGLEYSDGICPPHVEPAFLKSYAAGRQIQRLERENVQLEGQIESLRISLGVTATGTLPPELQRLKDRRARNDLSIREIEVRRSL